MDVLLLYETKEQKAAANKSPGAIWTREDLKLDFLSELMSNGDDFLLENIKPLLDPAGCPFSTALYRQQILSDFLNNESLCRKLYDFVSEALVEKAPHYLFFSNSPERVLEDAVRSLEEFWPSLKGLGQFAPLFEGQCHSKGLLRFWQMIEKELTTPYLEQMKNFLQELHFEDGLMAATSLDLSLKPTHYELCQREMPKDEGIIDHLAHLFHHDNSHIITISERDETGFRILSELRGHAVYNIAKVIASVRDFVHAFFLDLKKQLAFYIGALNLFDKLQNLGLATCLPQLKESGNALLAQGLYCPTLALQQKNAIVTNDIDASNQLATLIFGANQGGKTTFLISLGQAQIMASCGLFVASSAFCATVRPVFTHFKREEDASLNRGKFEEELNRMSEIIDEIRSGNLLLMNESFAATSELEGSQIALEVLSGLNDCQVHAIFVTHFHYLTATLYKKGYAYCGFYGAERLDDGARTFRIKPLNPEATSFGTDLYEKIFSEPI